MSARHLLSLTLSPQNEHDQRGRRISANPPPTPLKIRPFRSTQFAAHTRHQIIQNQIERIPFLTRKFRHNARRRILSIRLTFFDQPANYFVYTRSLVCVARRKFAAIARAYTPELNFEAEEIKDIPI